MSFDSREFRDALGKFATGVCVVTANSESEAYAFGMTVNSFASVSLDPPLILWSLQNDSDMFVAWDSARQFGVNILRADQVELSNQYAKKGDHRLAEQHYQVGSTGVPILPDSLVSLECEVEARYPGGDHQIIVARVLDLTERDNGEPLLFCAGSYRQLAG